MIRKVPKVTGANAYHDMIKQQMIRQLTKPKYCAFCGQPVLLSGTKEGSGGMPTINTAAEWEWENSAHWDCYTKHMRQMEREQDGT